MLLAEQLVRQRYVRPGPLVLGTAPIKYPAPTTDRDRTVSRRSEPSSRTALMGEQPNPWASVGNAVFSASTAQSVRAGFSIVPNRNDIRYYSKRVTYRAGAYWDQASCKLDGKAINAVGITLGATLPVFRWSNGLTLGVDFGQRGALTGNMVRERYVNFNIGINIFDIWFLKPMYN